MPSPLRLLGVFAHPDDESLGFGGSLAKYAAEGVETFVLTATRGQRGRYGSATESPGLGIVGEARESELRAAATELGVSEVRVLNYIDGELDSAPTYDIVSQIAEAIRETQPQVVVTFGPDGGYGHPDHVAISQFCLAAVAVAADESSTGSDGEHLAGAAHRVSKLYFMAWTEQQWSIYQKAFKRLVSKVDGVERQANPWPDWSITTRVDATEHWRTVWRAVQCHQTQIAVYAGLKELSEEYHQRLWGEQTFYRVFSSVNSGRAIESDLFEGLR